MVVAMWVVVDGVVGVAVLAVVASMFAALNHIAYSSAHLTPIQQGFTLFSEQAFYYSYYADLVDAPSYEAQAWAFVHDAKAEYPSVINAYQRFNIVPELVMAGLYRSVGHYLVADPFMFMLYCACGSVGLEYAAIYLLATALGRSRLTGLVATALSILNFFWVSRVQYHPELRETYALPFLWLEIWVLVEALRAPALSKTHLFMIAFFSSLFQICWQFGQFPLLIQATALYLAHAVGAIPSTKLARIYIALAAGVVVAAVVMFMNEMLLTSMYLFFCLSAAALVTKGPTNVVLRSVLLAVAVAVAKMTAQRLLGIEDDAHVFTILRAHLFGYEDFVTLQYLCGQAYNLMPTFALSALSASLVLPLASIVLVLLVAKVLLDWRDAVHTDPTIPFWFAQSCGFLMLGLLMMRMLPFFTPVLCILTSLLFTTDLYMILPYRVLPPPKTKVEPKEDAILQSGKKKKEKKGTTAKPSSQKISLSAVLFVVWWCLMGGALFLKSWDTWAAHFDREPQRPNSQDKELIVNWVLKNTDKDAVITSSMDLSSHLKLLTRRPITVHPHAEKHEMRKRYELQYSTYARMEEKHVHSAMKRLKSDYVVLPNQCWAQCMGGYGYDYIASKTWHKYVNSSRERFCEIALNHPSDLKFFDVVYKTPTNSMAILTLKNNARTQGKHKRIGPV